MMKKPFTIVELLVVIAVIGILAGLLLPVLGQVRENGKTTVATSEAKTIKTAILSFYNEYSYLPAPKADADTCFGASAANPATSIPEAKKALPAGYLSLFDRLCYTTLAEAAANLTKYNPKKISFLSPSSKYSSSAATEQGFRDPWGRPYMVYLDTDYNGRITGIDTKIYPNGTLLDRVGVFSFGRDGSLDTIEYLATSWN